MRAISIKLCVRRFKPCHDSYALVSHKDHDLIVAARNTSPMVLGLGEEKILVASDVPALLPYTRKSYFLT
ncbi:MAG: hypothetical protein R2865_00060 [Deinococcales bacterium]